MTKTAVAADEPGGHPFTTTAWYIEEFMDALHRPYWAVSAIRYDEPSALLWLAKLRTNNPDRQWRIKKVTTIHTEEVLNA